MSRWQRFLVPVAALLAGAGGTLALLRLGPGARPAAGGAALAPAAALRSWPEARQASRDSGLPVLLLATAPCSICPPGTHWRNELSRPEILRALSGACLPALLEISHASPSVEAAAFMEGHPDLPLPCLLVLSPQGDVLHRQIGSLYPPYDLKGQPLPGAWGQVLRAEELLALVDRSVGRQEREDRLLAARATDADGALAVEQARVLFHRDRRALALERALEAAGRPLQAADGLALARLLRRLSHPEAALAVLEGVWGGPAQPAERRRVALALLELTDLGDRARRARLPTLEALRQEATAAQDVAFEACVRADEAQVSITRGNRAEADAHVDWLRQRSDDLEEPACEAAGALRRFVDLAKGLGRAGDAAVFVEALLRRFPEREEGIEFRHGLLDELRQLPGGGQG